MNKRKLVYAFPFLYSLFPVFSLSSNNLTYVDLASIIRSLLISLLFTLIVYLLIFITTKNIYKSALFTFLVQTIFFSYGHLYFFFETRAPGIFRHRYMIFVFLVIFITGSLLILRSKRRHDSFIRYLFWSSLFLVIVSMYPTAARTIQAIISNDKRTAELFNAQKLTSQLVKPDIYLIILDSYTRADVLQKEYQFDNSEFLQELSNQGFYIGTCSTSNYPSTRFSIGSLMESNYIQDIFPDGNQNPFSISFVISNLRSLGYSVFSFENRSKGHFDLGEDRLLSRQHPLDNNGFGASGLNEFESELLETTFIKVFIDMPQLLPFFDLDRAEYYEHYQQVKYTVSELPNLANVASPKFVFVHILVPHEPYIITENGEYKYTSNKDKEGYLSGIKYINQEMLSIVQVLISESKIPPIIIIQGDHGSALPGVTPEIRHSILNAYYVNETTKANLYPSISPVNSFRVIFNTYFGTNLPLLDDKSYFAWGTSQLNDGFLVPSKCTP